MDKLQRQKNQLIGYWKNSNLIKDDKIISAFRKFPEKISSLKSILMKLTEITHYLL